MHILQQLEHEHTARVRSIVDGNVGWTCMQVEALKVHMHWHIYAKHEAYDSMQAVGCALPTEVELPAEIQLVSAPRMIQHRH
jgi:hypothetical protein